MQLWGHIQDSARWVIDALCCVGQEILSICLSVICQEMDGADLQ